MNKHGIGPLLIYHPEVTQYLLQNGADPDLQCNEYRYPVIVGIGGTFDCVRLMVEAEAEANVNRASGHSGETTLHGVAGNDDIRGGSLLLEHGASPIARTKPGMRNHGLWRDARVRGETLLHRAAADEIQM